MSPVFYTSGYSVIFYVGNNTGVTYDIVAGAYTINYPNGVRPAVSLKPGGTWSGDGTSDSPYQVSYS